MKNSSVRSKYLQVKNYRFFTTCARRS